MIKMTNHLQQERADRYAFIVTTIGLGTVVHTTHYTSHKYGDNIKLDITSTGVAMVYNPQGVLVTLYILRIGEARKYFDGELPMVLEAVIKKNMRLHLPEKQNQVKY